MRLVVTANGTDLDAQASPVFGRCPAYVFVDTETMAFETLENPAVGASGGAGIQAAQFVIERGAQAVVTGNVGPNAFSVFQAANVPMYLFGGGTVREAVEAYKAGGLQSVAAANVQAHTGMGMARGMGMGGGMGWGLGRGMGMGRRMATPPAASERRPAAIASREEEIASLKDMAGALRKQLADVIERLDRLEEGG